MQVEFRCHKQAYPMETAITRQFHFMCDLTIANYPAILWRPPSQSEITFYVPNPIQWDVYLDDEGCKWIESTNSGLDL